MTKGMVYDVYGSIGLLSECTGVIMGIQVPLMIIDRSLHLGHDWSVLGPYGNTLKGSMNT